MSKRTKELEAIFHAASELNSAEEQRRYLDEACAGDTELRRRVAALLSAVPVGDELFQSCEQFKPHFANPRDELDGQPGDRIGRYKLLEKIGEGGMGVVYMAEQREPVVRKVALKVIKAGMDTRQVVARFEAERQALAIMNHPNIAKVFDGGATGDSHPASGHPLRSDGRGAGGESSASIGAGRPFFVMELVQGLPITQFCDEAKLSTRQRLELFLDVCSAVQHAHQKGIIHRDLKPSNILVTSHGDKPVPKVIDFGVAKATQQRLTDKTVFTEFQHFIGTPAYMSPEQASLSGLDIDTRSDIYALGVLLYELLTGTTPFDGKELVKSGLDEMRRTIREKDPMRPSARLQAMPAVDLRTTAQRRRMEGPRLITALSGDLDWVAMKCLEKDRARRYETANGLAADVGRYLRDETVVARPPSVAYALSRTVARHKVAFAGSAIVLATLMTGFAVSTWMFLREREARQRAVAAEKVQIELRRESESARRKAEAGTTALLYWQAFNALPRISDEDRRELKALDTIADPEALAARYKDCFAVLQRATSIGSGCDWGINLDEDGPGTRLPDYRVVRQIADAAFLRAHVALSKRDFDGARRDLRSALVLARHMAGIGAIVSIVVQCEVEAGMVEFVARRFGYFPPEQMKQFIEELGAAPSRVNVARGARTERGGVSWIIREIQRVQFDRLGDDEAARQRTRTMFSEWFGHETWVDSIIAATDGTAAGLIAYFQQTAPYYGLLDRIAVATPTELRIEAANIGSEIDRSTNLVVQRVLPNLERARRREMETVARLAMLKAANAVQHEGLAGLQHVRDPFSNGPLAYHPTDAGFELRSVLADQGYDGSVEFVTSRRP